MDAIELLKHDHRKVEQLFLHRKVKQLFRGHHVVAAGPQRRAVVETLLREPSRHAALDGPGQLLARSEHTAPTRPHPHAPAEPPALSLAGPVAAAHDRLRDPMQGRPTT